MLPMRELGAGIVVIGNEILSGKTVDSNSAFLARELRQLGVTLKRITVIPDELDVIAETVRDFHQQFDIVFTSGGVGPTHDDITIEGVAQALGRRVIVHPVLESKIREYLNGRPANAAHLKMAEVPEGAELLMDDRLRFPTIKAENIYILPGIPEILQQKFLALKDRFAVDPYHLKIIYTNEIESTIAVHLNATLREYPDLLLGSYPKIGDAEYRVKVTLESKDKNYVERAFTHLLTLLPQGCVVKTEG
ncbi:MAG: competence/damage-inducible protein A [Deltaproteobacteria bacterium]|nr:competence/damage-inducible protein A [Deltaproteobacteria bacterium]